MNSNSHWQPPGVKRNESKLLKLYLFSDMLGWSIREERKQKNLQRRRRHSQRYLMEAARGRAKAKWAMDIIDEWLPTTKVVATGFVRGLVVHWCLERQVRLYNTCSRRHYTIFWETEHHFKMLFFPSSIKPDRNCVFRPGVAPDPTLAVHAISTKIWLALKVSNCKSPKRYQKWTSAAADQIHKMTGWTLTTS